jgi:hypothetical protein
MVWRCTGAIVDQLGGIDDSYRLRAKRKSGLIKPPAGDGPRVGSASLRPVTGATNLQPRP